MTTFPPRFQALHLYQRHSPHFADGETSCLPHGVLISPPTHDVAGRFCDDNDDDATLLDLHACALRQLSHLATPPTMLHAWLAVGNLASLASHLPESPPWISFERFRDQRGIRRIALRHFRRIFPH
jgi:hypothetical protein